ncbi:hypothetical protein GQ54DRAFT_311945 [Martensiomyces pterosporus]|nr:hypothetical protein GQ54DRAFT_311945 [Martensiomyces pterosporus]
MATKFKYNLEALEWDEDHMRNKEGVYCYCGLDYNEYVFPKRRSSPMAWRTREGDPMLKCDGCGQLFHWDCVSCLKTKPLRGDKFFRFRCSVCNGGAEEYERESLSWVQVIYVVLYHLIMTEPDKKYFRWRENICATINEHWENLMPGKAKTATWHNTVAGCLSTHNALFKSGFDDTHQPGNWTLHSIVEPSKARFKAPAKQRDPSKPSRREKAAEQKKAKRPAGEPRSASSAKHASSTIPSGSEAEKEILEVLSESQQAGSKRGSRHRVSFSDDESDNERSQRGTASSSKRPKAKRRRPSPKLLENDTDLLQSLALYTKLEKERLGSSSSSDKANADSNPGGAAGGAGALAAGAENAGDGVSNGIDGLESCSSLSSWSTDSELEDIMLSSDDDTGSACKSASANAAKTERDESLHEDRSKHATEASGGGECFTEAKAAKEMQEVNQRISSSVAAAASTETLPHHESCRVPNNALPDDEAALADASNARGPLHGRTQSVDSKFSEDTSEEQDRSSSPEIDSEDSEDETDSILHGISGTSLDGAVPQPLFLHPETDDHSANFTIMKERSEWEICAKLSSSRIKLTGSARRLQRRLQLRRFKRMLGLPLFDIDSAVKGYMEHQQVPWPERGIDRLGFDAVHQGKQGLLGSGSSSGDGTQGQVVSSPSTASAAMSRPGAGLLGHGSAAPDCALETAAGAVQVAAGSSTQPQPPQHTPYAHSFASRLLGRAVMRNSLTSPVPRISPFHGRLLRPFIWRDWKDMADSMSSANADTGPSLHAPTRSYSTRSLSMLHVQRVIRSHGHPLFKKMGLSPDALSSHESIDYVFFQREHLGQVNSLLCRTFWPGIDMSEALLYPEFSIVALYKRNVVGCAFLTPDAYLTYIAVAAGWEGAGIATFMIYHLTQTVPTKDVTLHVSATNLAMLLYQKFGFKPEKYAVNFYQAYLPESSRLCRNAFFMRLRRY